MHDLHFQLARWVFFTNMHIKMFFHSRSIISHSVLTIFFHLLNSLIVFVGEDLNKGENYTSNHAWCKYIFVARARPHYFCSESWK
jgi:hypothetical protein